MCYCLKMEGLELRRDVVFGLHLGVYGCDVPRPGVTTMRWLFSCIHNAC